MKKLKDIMQGIVYIFIAIPVMMITSIIDQRKFKKEAEKRKKEAETRN